MQRLDSMGDARHKDSPPTGVEEDVTPAFRAQVLEILDVNGRLNRLRKLRPGDPEYRICTRPELAAAVGTDKTMINKILGPVRPTTKIKMVAESTFVRPIRNALGLPPLTSIAVREDRAQTLRDLAELPDDEFRLFEDEVRRAARKANGDAAPSGDLDRSGRKK
jgi:hypothetical protein